MNKIKHFLRPAAIISALPNTIANGAAVDATPVMADFNHIVNQVNANAADVSLVALLTAANTFTLVQSGVSATSAANFPIATQVQDSVFLTLTSTLGTNTITARCAALALGALANGQIFTFIPSQTNTGPTTLDAGPGAATVFFGGTNVTSGQLVKDIPVAVRYQSPVFHMISMGGALAAAIAANKFTVDAATGNTVVAGSLDISGTAAGQVKFPATQNASSDANTLDDYEEGTWTASWFASSSGTITVDTSFDLMYFTKIGRQVTLIGQTLVSSVNSPNGTARIDGCPFTAMAGTEGGGRSAISLECNNWTAASGKVLQGFKEANNTSINIYTYDTAAGTEAGAASLVKATTSIILGCTYFTT